MTRKAFFKTLGLTIAGVGWAKASYGAMRAYWAQWDKLIIGHHTHRYKIDMNWGALDAEFYPVNDCHEMVQDSQGRIVLLTNDTRNNVLIYDKSGRLLEVWGRDYPGAHGLTLHVENGEDFLYIADNNLHEVIKTTIRGQVVQRFPYPADSGKYDSPEQYIPTETAIAPNGDVYIADGYGLQYILHYNAKGELQNVFGGRGEGEAHFDNAHGICLDTRSGAEPSLLITARQQNKLKRFSLSGELLDVIPIPGAFICRPVIQGQHVYCATLRSGSMSNVDSGFITILDGADKVVSVPGGNEPIYENGQLDPLYQTISVFKHPHDVCVDEEENLYVAQWNAGKTYPIKLIKV